MLKTARRTVMMLAPLLVAAALAAQDYTGTVRVQVRPDHDDWTYKTGEPARFRIAVTRDGVPVAGARVSYQLGPEMLPATIEKSEAVPAEGLSVAAGTMKQPGFLRLI